MQGKVCKQCEQWKPLSEFYKDSSHETGHKAKCKPCDYTPKPVRVYTAEEKFWMNTTKAGINECWEWTGSKIKGTYGQAHFYDGMTLAHRFSYTIHKGEIPDNCHVCHHCDNPSCVNPNHLFAGTQFDNMRDMSKKGRNVNPLGENCHLSKLTRKEVKEIRRLHKNGEPITQLAERFNVTYSNIRAIVLRWTWKHI